VPRSPEWMAGFQACLDLIKHSIADANTVEKILDTLQGIEAAVKEKQIEQIIRELHII
jgi:hypothetical protein